MRRAAAALVFGLSLAALAGCREKANAGAEPAKADAHTAQIAWRRGDVEDAFAEARESKRPVLLYWGAKWCPPCNAMKTGLFRDPAFIDETRAFVPVYLDGDLKGAQRWGERFHVAGYPTVVILRPDGSEVMRLANGDAPARLAEVLRQTAGRTTSADALIATARSDPAKLTPADWRLLANFDLFNDPSRFDDPKKLVPVFERLAVSAPDPAMRRQFALNALAVPVSGGDKLKLTPAQQAQLERDLPPLLADRAAWPANASLIEYAMPQLVAAVADPSQRRVLGDQLLATAAAMSGDRRLGPIERLNAVYPAIELGKAANGGKTPPTVLEQVRQAASQADRSTSGQMARQAMIPAIANALDEAGDTAGAVDVLKANVATAEAPAYLMSDIADLEAKLGHTAAGLDWARRSAETAQGPATRVQWAVGYATMVMEKTPNDRAAVERSAMMVTSALGATDAGYYERTKRAAERWGKALTTWSKAHDGAAVVERVRAQMTSLCATKGDAKHSCDQAVV